MSSFNPTIRKLYASYPNAKVSGLVYAIESRSMEAQAFQETEKAEPTMDTASTMFKTLCICKEAYLLHVKYDLPYYLVKDLVLEREKRQ